MTATETTGIWQPLRDPTSIRLLLLHPATNEKADICADLVESDLNDELEYEAISWTWGTAVTQRTITVNGQQLMIRDHLQRFLAILRRNDAVDRVLWVDAICINQNDNLEKNAQVFMMGDIFKKAKRVLAWLGEHADNSEALLRHLSLRPELSSRKAAYEHARNEEISLPLLSLEEGESLVCMWEAFLSRLWFHRTWIIQEVILAENLVLHCGNMTILWGQLPFWAIVPPGRVAQRDYQDAIAFQRRNPDIGKHLTQLATLQDQRELYRSRQLKDSHKSLRSINDLAIIFDSRWDCTDIRDKLYALIALEEQLSNRPRLLPDYALDIEGVFVSVFRQRCQHAWESTASIYPHAKAEERGQRTAKVAQNLATVLRLGDRQATARLLEKWRCEDDDEEIWKTTIYDLESYP